MKQPEILKEIARIEGEIARLAAELRALREQFDVAPPAVRRHTMSFSAPPPPPAAPSAAQPFPPPRSRARGRSLPPPAPTTGPQPPAFERTQDIQALSVESVPPPEPSPASRAHPRSSIRAIAIPPNEAPDSAPRTEPSGRDRADAGRYGFVAEPKSRAGTRAR